MRKLFSSYFFLGASALFYHQTAFSIDKAIEEQNLNPNIVVAKTSWELSPQVSVISPSKIILSNSQFQIPYSDLIEGIPAFYLSLAKPLKYYRGFQIFGIARLGFSYESENYLLVSRSGEKTRTLLTLAWLPLSVGTKIQWNIPSFPFVRPSLTVGAGVQWLSQSGSTPGLSTNFYLPFYYISPSFGFFEGTSDTDWFGGFHFGITYQDSIDSGQRVRAESFDLSISILL